MNKKELSQLYYIKRSIERNERKLKSLKSNLNKITQEISDMPRSQNVGDKISDSISDIIDTERLLVADQERKVVVEKQLTTFIKSIDDCRTQLIFELRFIDCLKWPEVAVNVGPYETADSARKLVDRYLKNLSVLSA